MANKQHGTKIEVGFPDKLELQMVQANELRHYELFQWLVSLLSSILEPINSAIIREACGPIGIPIDCLS